MLEAAAVQKTKFSTVNLELWLKKQWIEYEHEKVYYFIYSFAWINVSLISHIDNTNTNDQQHSIPRLGLYCCITLQTFGKSS